MIKTELGRRGFIKRSLVYSFGSIGMAGGLHLLPEISGKEKKLPGGFWPVMMTPYTNKLDIDYPGLKRLITWYEDAGSTGLFANCGSSEMYQLNSQERLDLTRFVVENTSLPVVSTGTFSDTDNGNIEFIKQVADTGVEAVVLIPSMMVKKTASEADLMKSFENILNQTADIALGIYECPGPYHRLISPDMVSTLQSTDRFLYFKDTSCEAAVVQNKIIKAGDSALGIYNAHSPDVLDSIRHGGAGISCIAGNFYPELFSYLWAKGRKRKVLRSVQKANAFILANDRVIGNKYPRAAKYFMNLRGLDLTINTRKNTPELNSTDKEKLDQLWEDLQNLSSELKIPLATYV